MNLTLISDTHGKHHDLTLPKGDVLIHAGDVSNRGLQSEVTDFLEWFSSQDYKYKIFIAGNHDFYFEDLSKVELELLIPDDVIYLNDSGIEIEGISFWGSPVQPRFYDWAFNRDRGDDIQTHWDLIPADTDVLITHGPPYSILDMTTGGINAGCENLMETMDRLKVKLHVFGHIHEAYGIVDKHNRTYVNASVLNESYNLANEPIIYNYDS